MFKLVPARFPIKKAPYRPEASIHPYPFADLSYRPGISLLYLQNIFPRIYPKTHVFYILMILLQSDIFYYFLSICGQHLSHYIFIQISQINTQFITKEFLINRIFCKILILKYQCCKEAGIRQKKFKFPKILMI